MGALEWWRRGVTVVLGWLGQAVLVYAESEIVANGYTSSLRTDKAHCPPDRVLTNTLLATYFPGLQESAGKCRDTVPVSPPACISLQIAKRHGQTGYVHPTNRNPKSTIPSTRALPLRNTW